MMMKKALTATLAALAVVLALSPSANALPTFACTPEDLFGCLGL